MEENEKMMVYQDETVIAYVEEKNPVAKIHFVVTAKDAAKAPTSLIGVTDDNSPLLGHMMRVVAQIAKEQGLQDGYRTVINSGKHAVQNSPSLQIDIIGGQLLTWPPGVEANPPSTAVVNINATNPEVNDLCN